MVLVAHSGGPSGGVARGDGVPGLFPWTAILVLLVLGLQVGRLDQTSEGQKHRLRNQNRALQTRTDLDLDLDRTPRTYLNWS